MSTGDPCPDGYTYRTGVCIDGGGNIHFDEDQSSCEDENVYWGSFDGDICVKSDLVEGDEVTPIEDWSAQPTASAPKNCSECPIGSTCTGGTTAAVPCPAGSYCATTGLAKPTGLCALNSYSTGGATTCSACPATELTDKDGKTVVAKTATTGTDTPAKCFIDPNAYFKNTKGTYHFKSNCAFDLASQPTCEYFDLFMQNNPTDYTCKEDPDYDEDAEDQMHHFCDSEDSDCITNHIQNCNLYRTAYENEECDDDGCFVDLGNGITCRY